MRECGSSVVKNIAKKKCDASSLKDSPHTLTGLAMQVNIADDVTKNETTAPYLLASTYSIFNLDNFFLPFKGEQADLCYQSNAECRQWATLFTVVLSTIYIYMKIVVLIGQPAVVLAKTSKC